MTIKKSSKQTALLSDYCNWQKRTFSCRK